MQLLAYHKDWGTLTARLPANGNHNRSLTELGPNARNATVHFRSSDEKHSEHYCDAVYSRFRRPIPQVSKYVKPLKLLKVKSEARFPL
jgi:hypothetical protein